VDRRLVNYWSAQGFGEKSDELLVLLDVRPPKLESPDSRPPVCLGVAIDRSSSMVGTRMSLGVEAVRQICSGLGERDSLCIVAFDAGTKVVKPPGAVSGETALGTSRDLMALGLGYGTNIAAGRKKTAELLSRSGMPAATKTLLLLTDGYPTLGPNSIEKYVEMVQDGNKAGICTNTVGVGPDFLEDLLLEMARAGDGTFRYVQGEQDAVAVADEEGVGTAGLFADSSTFAFEFSDAVNRYEVLNDLRCESPEGKLTVHLGRLFAGSPRNVLLSLSCGAEADDLGLVRASFNLRDEPARIESIAMKRPTEGSEAEASRHVGAAYVPLLVARGLRQIWELGLRSDIDPVLMKIGHLKAALSEIPEPFVASDQAKAALEYFRDLSEEIEKEGAVSQNARKNTTEYLSRTGGSRPLPLGWGKRR
jgi:hypothetical protein